MIFPENAIKRLEKPDKMDIHSALKKQDEYKTFAG